MLLFRYIHIMMLAGLISSCSIALRSQSPFDRSYYPAAFQIREHLEVFTDRSIYVVGEPVQFRADHFLEGLGQQKQWSSVLYVELITSSEMAVAQGKFALSGGLSTGILYIPAGIHTGNYFLKCYTRWMRNRGPGEFCYLPLKIVNPFNPGVNRQMNGDGSDARINREEYKSGIIECRTQASVYERDEMVQFQITGKSATRHQHMNCCIAVVPAGGIDTVFGQLTFPGDSSDLEDFSVNYLPDLNGASLSGKVIQNDQKGDPVPSADIYFSLLGVHSDYFTTKTDAYGRFVVSLPDRRGIQELFVTPDPSLQSQVEVRIDQDFDTQEFSIPGEKFELSLQEREAATRMAIHTQLSAAYCPKQGNAALSPDSTDSDTISFYGTPVHTLVMDEYIKLPTMEEVFINLIPEVQVEVRRGISSLKIFNPTNAVEMFRPLIMIDHIPVFNQQAVLAIAPEKIMKVDVINEVYVKGNVFHGGVINIISRKGDMAGIDLPNGSYFFDFQSIKTRDIVHQPLRSPADRVPDTRNTILWLDDVLLERDSIHDFSFRAPSQPGDFVVLVRGMAGPGEPLSAIARFQVK